MLRLLLLFLVSAWKLHAASNQVDVLAFGDWGYGSSSSKQRAVAEQMERYARKQGIQFEAALLLGDNFYRPMPDGAEDRRWRSDFEKVYDDELFAMPFYAALGNHDYEKNKVRAQLDYARENPQGRWKLPAKWYAVSIPSNEPLVTLIVLDSNWKKLSREERTTQNKWLEQQLASGRNGEWIIAAAHHPLFSNGRQGDVPLLIEDWGRPFKRHNVDFYLCGHDHTLQHLELERWPISFMISGGGGAKLQELRRDDRGPFSRLLHGFVHLQFKPDEALARYVSVEGDIVHEFIRSPGGKVEVLRTTGRDKPTKKKKKDKDDDEDEGD